jgi:hypothetical protein
MSSVSPQLAPITASAGKRNLSAGALDLPQDSVRYVKNGTGGQWWRAAEANHQIHLGWSRIPHELLLNSDLVAIERKIFEYTKDKGAAKRDFQQLRCLLDVPSQHIWITFEDDCMWWCTVRDGAEMNPLGMDKHNGNFWLVCERPWSNRSIKGKLLAISDLPGSVTAAAGFRGTVCRPRDWQAILRIIRGEEDPDVAKAADARSDYERAVYEIVKRLTPKDFEQLIDLVLARSGWTRISTLGGTREGIDVEAENLTADEIAFVQVKSSSTQAELNRYIGLFKKRRDRYARMIFAVHSPKGKVQPPAGLPVQVWTGEKVARLVVRLGLGPWVESRLA